MTGGDSTACFPDWRARLAELVHGYELAQVPTGPFNLRASRYYQLDAALSQGLSATIDLLDRRSSEEEWLTPSCYFLSLLECYSGIDDEYDAHRMAGQLIDESSGVTLDRYRPERHFSSGSWYGMSFHMVDFQALEKTVGARALRSDLQCLPEDPATFLSLETERAVRRIEKGVRRPGPHGGSDL